MSNKNEYFYATFYEMYKMENKENKVNKDIVRFLLTYKWTEAYTAYGSKKNPDPRDGFYKHICVGVDKDKDEEADDQSDQRFQVKQFGKHLQDALVDPQVREKRAQYKQMGKENPRLYYDMMTSLQQVLKTPCRVELEDTEYVIGASMYVRKENFDRFWGELCEIRHLHLL
tara:strand:- start:65 stop:577 length:513 start_codon:yes stop_codon:yes gene_type:complete